MSWKHLRKKGTEILTSKEWNTVVDALDELYNIVTSGTESVTVDTVNARTGNFEESIYVQDRPVLKDGDPISLYDILEPAQEKLREVIPQVSVDEYGRVRTIVESPVTIYDISEYAQEKLRQVIPQITVDEYGRVGVIISEPLDEYGRVRVHPHGLIDDFTNRFADAWNNIRMRLADTDIALPVDIQYRVKEEFTLFSGTATASGNTADIAVEKFSAMEVEVKVTAVSGETPTLQVCIQGKFGTTGDYKDIICTDTISSTGIWFMTIDKLVFKTIRVRWVVGGTTPSFTFRVDAVATV